jgi:hypothetical protein
LASVSSGARLELATQELKILFLIPALVCILDLIQKYKLTFEIQNKTQEDPTHNYTIILKIIFIWFIL